MATVGTAVTYLDITSRLAPDNTIKPVIELMRRTNRVMDDMLVVQGNLPTGHQTTVRVGLPTVTWRLLNYGVQPSKSITSKITDTTGMLESYAQVDKSLADLNGNAPAWRLSEDQAFLEAMNQQMATTTFYGNTATNPERFMGLMPRYPQFGTAASALNVTARNCVNAYASAANAVQTSMWLIVWGANTVHGIYPKGSESGGFTKEDKGQVTLTDAEGGLYEGYRTHYKWDLGLTVRDWRYAVRICNIDTVAMTDSVVDLFRAMTAAYYRVPSLEMGNAVFYANALVLEFLHAQRAVKSNVALTLDEVGGKQVLSYLGIPIHRCDALINTEAVALTI
jgi:hypothetical protein